MKIGNNLIFLCLSCLATSSVYPGQIEVVEVINAGASGNNSANLLRRIAKDVIAERPDLVVLMVGTNDMVNSRRLLSLKEYKKNLEEIASILKGAGINLILVTPPLCIENLLLNRHDAEAFGSRMPNVRLMEAADVVRKVGDLEGVPVVDFQRVLNENELISLEGSSLIRNPVNSGKRDGVHPTPEGYRMLAELVAEAIRENGYEVRKIVCFGDSLTFGSHVEGAGTSDGETYPARLEKLFLNQGKEL